MRLFRLFLPLCFSVFGLILFFDSVSSAGLLCNSGFDDSSCWYGSPSYTVVDGRSVGVSTGSVRGSELFVQDFFVSGSGTFYLTFSYRNQYDFGSAHFRVSVFDDLSSSSLGDYSFNGGTSGLFVTDTLTVTVPSSVDGVYHVQWSNIAARGLSYVDFIELSFVPDDPPVTPTPEPPPSNPVDSVSGSPLYVDVLCSQSTTTTTVPIDMNLLSNPSFDTVSDWLRYPSSPSDSSIFLQAQYSTTVGYRPHQLDGLAAVFDGSSVDSYYIQNVAIPSNTVSFDYAFWVQSGVCDGGFSCSRSLSFGHIDDLIFVDELSPVDSDSPRFYSGSFSVSGVGGAFPLAFRAGAGRTRLYVDSVYLYPRTADSSYVCLGSGSVDTSVDPAFLPPVLPPATSTPFPLASPLVTVAAGSTPLPFSTSSAPPSFSITPLPTQCLGWSDIGVNDDISIPAFEFCPEPQQVSFDSASPIFVAFPQLFTMIPVLFVGFIGLSIFGAVRSR